MRLILVRHGETDHNREHLTLGRADVPLNDRGRAQAQALAASFTNPPAAIFTSPLRRAAETAAAITVSTRVVATAEPDLVEMDVGEMEHLTRSELRDRYPEFLRQWLSADAADARMPGGETLREVQDRAWAVLARIATGAPAGEVVVVSHNFVILTVICRALALPLDRFRHLRHEVAARTVLDMKDGGATLIQLNDRAHLLAAGLGGDPAPEART